MFTGVIEAAARVEQAFPGVLCVSRPAGFDDLKTGSSVSVAGVCLSVTALTPASITFDVVGETQRLSTLGALKPGDRVNLERALPAGGRFEGHVVQGHVEGVGEVVSLRSDGAWTTLAVRLPEACAAYAVPKGSIAIDGVSLTVASVEGGICTAALIPHTLAHTTLGCLRPGGRVNIETDVLVRSLLHSRS